MVAPSLLVQFAAAHTSLYCLSMTSHVVLPIRLFSGEYAFHTKNYHYVHTMLRKPLYN
jgi:hypothetical protein